MSAGRGVGVSQGNFFARFVIWVKDFQGAFAQSQCMDCREQRAESVDSLPPRPCGDCGREMTLAALLPRLGALPELRSYRCAACGNVELDVLEHFGSRPSAPALTGRR
jgi:hypothetical protein